MLMFSPASARLRESDGILTSYGKVRYGPELRVLIVGGGVGGLTLAALLQQRGFAPVVVEKTQRSRDAGYVIGLWPAGSKILKGLGLFPALCDLGVECSRYIVSNEQGETLHSFSFQQLTERYGPLIDVSRVQLLELLRSVVDERRIRCGASVTEICETPEGIAAVFEDGRAELFDLVVGCDGIHSTVRRLVFAGEPLEYCGVMGWAFWLPPDFVPPPEVVEFWGTGKFVGLYPARRRFCAVLAMQASANDPDPVETRQDRVRRAFAEFGGIVPWVLRELPAPGEMLPLDFSDVRMEQWTRGHVVLIGDAAHAILPTGGMGASLAMESAALLAEELCRTDSKFLIAALEKFVERRRARVDRIQSRSRRLGKVMFAESGVMTRLRDRVVRIIADEPVLDQFEGMLTERI